MVLPRRYHVLGPGQGVRDDGSQDIGIQVPCVVDEDVLLVTYTPHVGFLREAVADYKKPDGTYDIGSMAYSVSQYFKMGNTEVQVRSSGYARFADTELPREVLDGEATVTLTGILTDYKGAAQFTLIDLDGVAKADGTLWY